MRDLILGVIAVFLGIFVLVKAIISRAKGKHIPAVLVDFDEENDTATAYTEDGRASLSIENMQGGKLTEDVLLEAIKLEAPDAEPVRNQQNNCIRVDRVLRDAGRCRTDLYLIGKDSFHHVTIEYPADEQETYAPYIEYMINTMGTNETDLG